MSAKDLASIAFATAIIVVCSWICLPLAVPVTLQTFGIFTTTGILGMKRGTIATLLYLFLGVVGLPVFSGFKGGIGALVGPTGGYIIGFVITALILGWMTERFGKKSIILALGMMLGLAACYLLGTLWFMRVYAQTTGPLGLMTVLSWCVFPFLVPDAIKITLSIMVVKRVSRIISKS